MPPARLVAGAIVPADHVWPLLDSFFRGHMHRQTLVPGALDAQCNRPVRYQWHYKSSTTGQFAAYDPDNRFRPGQNIRPAAV